MTNTVRTYRRNYNLKAMYGHGQGCQCGKCSPSQPPQRGGAALSAAAPPPSGGGWEGASNRFARIPDAVEDAFLKRLYKSKWKRNHIDKVMWQEYYTRLRQFVEAGMAKKLTDPESWEEFELMEKIKRNISTFSAGKVNTITEELRRLKKLSEKDFKKFGKKTLERHHRYLETECRTALKAALNASQWQEYVRLSYLYPNLRYETIGDELVRDSHRQLDGAVYPVNHSFWNTWMPPNGWDCRCFVLQTDDPVQEVPDGFDMEAQRGFDNNPGKTGKLFADDHPYFDWSEKDFESMAKTAEQYRADWEMDEIYKKATASVGEKFRFKGMGTPAEMTEEFISSTLKTTHIEQAIKNDLLMAMFFLESVASLSTIDESTYIYNIVVAGFTFTLRVKDGVLVNIS